MKLPVTIAIVILGYAVISFIRGGEPMGHPAHLLPLLGGYEPGVYDAGAFIMCIIAIVGISRLLRGSGGQETSDAPDEPAADDSADVSTDDAPADDADAGTP